MSAVNAQSNVSVSPEIINENAKASDLFDYTVKLKNNTDRQIDLYVLVYDYSVDQDGKKVLRTSNNANRENSVSSWIRIRRGATEIKPGEEKELDLKVEISQYAKPGRYFAVIKFAPGSDIGDARKAGENQNVAEILLNYNVEEIIVEKAQIAFFSPKQNVFFKAPAEFNVKVNNSGNRSIVPQGNVYLFNRRGAEIAALSVNPDKEKINSETEADFKVFWDDIKGFGKYKAKVELKYGGSNDREMQDTIYFWMMPWPLLSIFGGVLLLIVVALTAFLFKKSYSHHPAHLALSHLQQGKSDTQYNSSGDGVLDLKNK